MLAVRALFQNNREFFLKIYQSANFHALFRVFFN